jgi:uncharacterized protein (TIGR02246 family)
MRNIILLLFLFIAFSTAFAQNKETEKKAIEAQIDAFINSWNKHDFNDMKDYIAEECDFINIVGMHWKGRKDIQYAHQTFHDQHFKNTPMEKRSLSIRFLKPDIAIAHLLWRIGAFDAPDGSVRGNNDDLATIVFVKSSRKWMITAMENVEISEQAKPFDPVKMRQQQNTKKQ